MRKARSGVSPKTHGAPKDFLAFQQRDLKPESEQGIFDWCNRLAARHGGTLQPTLSRNELTVVAPNYDQDPIGRIARGSKAGSSNRVISGKARRDFSRFPTYTIVRGRDAGEAASESSAKNATKTFDSAALTPETQRVAVSGRVKPTSKADANGKLYRLLYIHDRMARTDTQIQAAAFRAIWDRLKDTLVYTVSLRGHRDPDSNAIWSVDTIVDVNDEIANVREKMWVASRRLSYDPQNGAQAELTCWRIGAYQTGNSTS
jgi:prophage tail gpP-like protein